MKIPEQAAKPILTRLKRAHGHLATVIRMLEDGNDCEDVLTQLAAVNKALGRSGYALVATGLQHCMTTEGPDNVDQQKLERLFLALA
ncbi:metal-sensitive transcriptional regulator [Tsukamurella tyrosinosolvens]|uniref:metal-sensitive transcriptional regulator n=1 Tax=Tsukamurella tyrosinosolvens TaxID=57704 RepID=UPI0007972405|nr:metal-sensitive transcriptional regulator [Tsukamurella tyrosinosolvens]KXP07663.1 cytoplasmic protein [Tsukamurella tyrosinosolvens]KZL98866.1 cytoplasmic protein [Tsukamurella tyrosinosolvens]MCA4995174.1 metal-sensitive transcriptional regulator [Tsukamurella tyrosinosolvens]